MSSNQKMMAIAIRKSLLKETTQSNYSSGSKGEASWASLSMHRAVYMNDGDEFQIQLFNPERFQVGCLIYINGTLMSQRKIVLRPGERIWLDRHIDSPDKLRFSTYEVSGRSKEVKEAIRDNGLVKVEFYREQEKHKSIKLTYSYDPWDISKPLGDPIGIYHYSESPYSVCSAADVKLGMNSCINASCAADIGADISAMFSSLQGSEAKTPRHIETGRVDKGSHSDQEFKNVNEEFEYYPYRTEEVKILPMSQKLVRPNDLKKRFCPYCGKKIKEGFKFCPFCGKEL